MKEEGLNLRRENKIGTKTEGALFLAMSFFALLTVGILGYLKYSGMDGPPVLAANIVQEEIVPEVTKTVMQMKIEEKLPAARDAMVIPTGNQLQGKWVSLFEHGGIVNLSFFGDGFEVIHMHSLKSAVRKYSRGTYKYDEATGKITLYPSKETAVPVPAAGVHYKILTMRHYDMFVSKLPDDVSLYFVAPEEKIVTKDYYPLFSYADFGGAPVLQFFPRQVQ